MTKSNIAEITGKLYKLIKDLEPDDRKRVLAASMMLFGEVAPDAGAASDAGSSNAKHTPKSFMHEKNPQNKNEALAVAARYRELYDKSDTHTKEDLKNVFADSRRNLDARNYARDIKNARNQSGYFNKSTAKGSETLSYYGQNYVDALPDREAAKKVLKPKIRIKSKSAAKKKLSSKAKK